MTASQEQVQRWRLILGEAAQESLAQAAEGDLTLSAEQQAIDEALAAIYDETDEGATDGEGAGAGPAGQGAFGAPVNRRRGHAGGERSAGLGGSAPHLARWLGDVRTYFKEDVVSVIQHDAIERRGLRQLLLEPEVLKTVKPDIAMVGTLLSLSQQIPEHTKETAREVVRAVVEQIKDRLEQQIRMAVTGALNRREHSPIAHVASTDWKRTIQRNLKNFDQDSKRLIAERFYFFSRAQRTNTWNIILDLDQSGSMAESVVYGAVVGSIFASLPAVSTRVVAFDTGVVDLTEQCGDDPVDMLFGVQLGGGTDINKSVAYCEQFIEEPAKTLFILVTDLYEGGNEGQLVRRVRDMVDSGVRVLCLLALSDAGASSYDQQLARRLAKLGVPCFACTPNRLPDLVEGALRGHDLQDLADRLSTSG